MFIGIQCRQGNHAPACAIDGCRCVCHDVYHPPRVEKPARVVTSLLTEAVSGGVLAGPRDRLGWLAPELNRLIEADFGEDFPEGKSRAAPLVILSPFWVGTDPIRVQVATGLPWLQVLRITGRLFVAGIWERNNRWSAGWADTEKDAAEVRVEFVLHVLVAEGRAAAERAEDGTFRFRSIERRPYRWQVFDPSCRCARCGHAWRPRRAARPKVCPKCKSSRWERSVEKTLTKRRGRA